VFASIVHLANPCCQCCIEFGFYAAAAAAAAAAATTTTTIAAADTVMCVTQSHCKEDQSYCERATLLQLACDCFVTWNIGDVRLHRQNFYRRLWHCRIRQPIQQQEVA